MRVCKLSAPSSDELRAITESHQPPDYVTSRGRQIRKASPPDESGAGVYFVGAMGANLVKIGWVRQLDKIAGRLDRMRIDCPFPVMVLLTVGPATRHHEARLHRHFEPLHHHGEWFRYDGEIRAIVDLAANDPEAAATRVRAIFTVRFGRD